MGRVQNARAAAAAGVLYVARPGHARSGTAAVLLLAAAVTAAAAVSAAAAVTGPRAARWGMYGHEISGKAAATGLPIAMPSFFREATEQLAYLNPEPDRWRGDGFRELNEAMRYDHYIDFEIIPDTLLALGDRFLYLTALRDIGMTHPARESGVLPFRIIELYQRLIAGWRLWRAEPDAAKRRFIEQRILNDAGILGHYVADGANPHHTSVHHDRWVAGYPNPRGYTTERGFHSRFETQFVEARIRLEDLLPNMHAQPREIRNIRDDVFAYLRDSHSRLERLYELDLIEPFGRTTEGAAHREFAIERLSAGSNMLRSLWWSAWLHSDEPVPPRR